MIPMAAVLSPRTHLDPSAAPWNPSSQDDRAVRRSSHLRLVEGGLGERSPRLGAARRPVLGLVGGLLVALTLALAASGAVQLLGADAAASGPASTAGPLPTSGADASTSSASEVVVVQAGDTLWAIARRLHPEGDVRPVVDELAERAGGPGLVVGQRLDVSGLAD
jgi:hypothetical protein